MEDMANSSLLFVQISTEKATLKTLVRVSARNRGIHKLKKFEITTKITYMLRNIAGIFARQLEILD